jgi:hypothetical protein
MRGPSFVRTKTEHIAGGGVKLGSDWWSDSGVPAPHAGFAGASSSRVRRLHKLRLRETATGSLDARALRRHQTDEAARSSRLHGVSSRQAPIAREAQDRMDRGSEGADGSRLLTVSRTGADLVSSLPPNQLCRIVCNRAGAHRRHIRGQSGLSDVFVGLASARKGYRKAKLLNRGAEGLHLSVDSREANQ